MNLGTMVPVLRGNRGFPLGLTCQSHPLEKICWLDVDSAWAPSITYCKRQ